MLIEIIPAIMPKTIEDIYEKVGLVTEALSFQLDIMDGKFVPEKTFPFFGEKISRFGAKGDDAARKSMRLASTGPCQAQKGSSGNQTKTSNCKGRGTRLEAMLTNACAMQHVARWCH